jgi:hypothetical protein
VTVSPATFSVTHKSCQRSPTRLILALRPSAEFKPNSAAKRAAGVAPYIKSIRDKSLSLSRSEIPANDDANIAA